MKETTFNMRKCVICRKSFISDSYKDTCSICGGRWSPSGDDPFKPDYRIRIGDCVFYPYGDSWIESKLVIIYPKGR